MYEIRVTGSEAIADWIETALLREGHGAGNTAIESMAAEQIGADAAAVGLALNVMARRAELLRDRYPFAVTSLGVQMTPNKPAHPYTALLLMTPGGLGRYVCAPSPTPSMAALFERLTCAALIGLLGPHSNAIRFGWPSEAGRPPEFPAAVLWLASKMKIAPGTAYRPPRRKDGGVDVIAWRPFPDGRSGFPLVLVQCTLQQDFVAKANDVDVRTWAGWLTLDVDPTVALAVPGTIPPDESWNEVAAKCLVLERLRLADLIGDDIEIDGLEPEVDKLLGGLRDAH